MPKNLSSNEREKAVGPCARCNAAETSLVVRTEHLCRICFMKYIATKVLKRLESNKLRGGFKDPQRTLLVPISFGVSSIVLLHLLDQQLKNRSEAGRHSGYSLHILCVDPSAVLEQASLHESLDVLKQRYPSHTYTIVSLEDCCEYGIDFHMPVFSDVMTDGHTALDKRTRLKHILSSLPSATSRVDMIEMLRRRLIFTFAKVHACDSVLFGDSTTRLAERTLSETAKGRAFALPWLTADGSACDGTKFIYPLRDLLRKELEAYASLTSPPLTPLISEVPSQTPTSSKDATIDGLMAQYFETVEQNYPSIVANVVRTTGRLVPPSTSGGTNACGICGRSSADESWSGRQSESAVSQLADSNESGSGSAYGNVICYSCARVI